MKKLFTFLILTLICSTQELLAQCAMCRATIENNVSNGEAGIAANLNFGILYLFVIPYIMIGVVGFLWYRSSKKNQKKADKQKRFALR